MRAESPLVGVIVFWKWARMCVCLALAGCTPTQAGMGGLALSNLKSPLRVDLSSGFPANKALDGAWRERFPLYYRDRSVVETCKRNRSGGFGKVRRSDCIEAFRDFQGEDTLVVVAISGGGARSARLAAHALHLLEARYNSLFPSSDPFIERIDAFSTVSGGSLYAYQVARRLSTEEPPLSFDLGRLGKGKPEAPDAGRAQHAIDRTGVEVARRTFFRDTVEDFKTDQGTSLLGVGALQSAIGAYGTGLISTLFTDWSYLNHLAKGMELSRKGMGVSLFIPARFASDLFFDSLPDEPRFYFNATALETGGAFVFTQRITNLPIGRRTGRSARLDLHNEFPTRSSERCANCDPARPLRSSLTLSEIGSSPANFPVAYAAAASAAFPFGVEPLRLRKYSFSIERGTFMRTKQSFSLADGGVYDNSGMTTAADLYEYLSEYYGVRHLVLIAINADTTQFDPNLAGRAARGPGLLSHFKIGWPVPSLFSAADSLNLIHFVNKRRGEDIAWARLADLDALIQGRKKVEEAMEMSRAGRALPAKPDVSADVYEQLRRADQLDEGARRRLERTMADMELAAEKPLRYVHYFPINLAQLAASDEYSIVEGSSFYDDVEGISTGYWLGFGDDRALEAAASKIVSTPQEQGWAVGPRCPGSSERAEALRLEDAVAFAIARANAPSWDADLSGDTLERWCDLPDTRPESRID